MSQTDDTEGNNIRAMYIDPAEQPRPLDGPR
jgi:hypothetical protein